MNLQDLLSRYETAIARGESVTPEEACREHPELLDQFRLHAKAIRGIAPPSVASGTVITTTFADETAARFTVLKPHARGGLGEVYLARDENLGRDVALKVMSGPGQNERQRRFEREAAITGRLQHPGIVPVYGTGKDDRGRPCHVMRFISGPTLAEAFEAFHATKQSLEHSNPQFRQLLARIAQVAQTIAFAHSRGVVHRDLKPGNVILGEFGETLVVDWGLAKELKEGDSEAGETTNLPIFSGELAHDATTDWIDPVADVGADSTRQESKARTGEAIADKTQAGVMLGTPAYLSPEQALGGAIAPATDVFALGGLLYHLLTGSAPFGGFETMELLERTRVANMPSARSRRGDVPAGLAAVCEKAMARAPGDRYPDALSFVAELERWLADEPLAVVADPLSVRLRRWARRHRLLVATSVAALVVSAVALAVATGLLSSKNTELREAVLLAETNERAANAASDLATMREKEALANFQTACDAVDQFTMKVSDDPRLLQHDLDKLRKDLLASAGVFYRQLAERRGDEPTLRRQIVQARVRLGLITKEMGDRAGAEREYREAIAFAAAQPGDRSRERLLGESEAWLELGAVLRMKDDMKGGLEAIRAAHALRVEALGEQPANAADRRDLAVTQLQIANTLSLLHGDTPEANAAFDRAEALTRLNYQEARDRPLFWIVLPETLKERGNMKQRAENFKAAEKYWQAAGDLLKELPANADSRAITTLQHQMVEINLQLGNGYRMNRNTDGAERCFQDAHAIASRLAAKHPSIAYYRSDKATSLLALGSIRNQNGDHAAAEPMLREALELRLALFNAAPEMVYERHGLINTRGQYTTALAGLKKVKEAAEQASAAEMLLKPGAGDMPLRVTVVVAWCRVAMNATEQKVIDAAFDRGLSVAAVAAQPPPAIQAMLMLQQLAKAGCFKDEKRAARLASEEFAALKNKPDFQALLPKK